VVIKFDLSFKKAKGDVYISLNL